MTDTERLYSTPFAEEMYSTLADFYEAEIEPYTDEQRRLLFLAKCRAECPVCKVTDERVGVQ